jgi:PIN domain nuclease of toxin-antitoxin system
MKLLLDTHIWLWSLLEPQRLSRRVAKALADSRNELWISPISTWEILVLCRKGRLVLNSSPATWILAALKSVPLREATLTHEVAAASEGLVPPHRDPADSFLAASAKVYELTLVTADENLAAGKEYAVFLNR